MDLRISPPEEMIDATIELPISKSVANRTIFMQALAGNYDFSDNEDTSDDVRSFINGIKAPSGSTVDVGAAGTAMRFLTAFFSIKPEYEVTIDGSDRMRERPIGPLVDALRKLGASIEYLGKEGFPPLKVKGVTLKGGDIEMDATISSQYISALMMIAPYMDEGLTINLIGNPVSMSYIRLTASLMNSYGIEVEIEGSVISVPNGQYTIDRPKIELDWSAASYWAQIVALSAGFISLPGLSLESNQPDRKIIELFHPLAVDFNPGQETDGVEIMANPEVHSRLIFDLSDNPDMTQTLAVTCVLQGIPFEFTGLRTLKIKETDRIEALKTELLRLGCILETNDSNHSIAWDGTRYPIRELPVFETYNDHRMAMALAPAALYIPGIIIRNAEVVKKSYPQYWNDLIRAGFIIEEVVEEASPLDEGDS